MFYVLIKRYEHAYSNKLMPNDNNYKSYTPLWINEIGSLGAAPQFSIIHENLFHGVMYNGIVVIIHNILKF